MAFGFPAYTEKTVRFKGLSRKDLTRAAMDALDDLGWRPAKDGKACVRASVPMGFHIIFLTWGAKFIVEADDGELFIRSEGIVPIEWMDIGQHGANINKFLDRFEEILDDRR
jgi:hypothetical protein